MEDNQGTMRATASEDHCNSEWRVVRETEMNWTDTGLMETTDGEWSIPELFPWTQTNKYHLITQ